ncbi:hypothetical protein RN001_015389 [Aquatica leii]|uniref:Uncharacterized protein n=1 Tax=Aquatica leii TaxID=1421715 RepID=A0AAN7SNI0_9COLE|nr:hypothetical protein RN001_015389 [Aquatica leii]
MSHVLKFSVIFVLLSVIAANSTFNLKSLLKNVPEKERINFLKHYVSLGYKLDNNNQEYSPSLKLPDDAAVALYRYVKKHNQIFDEDVLKLARIIICFPDGSCIDTGDVGVHPKF